MLCNKTVKITFCGHRDVIEYNAVYKELLSTLEQFFIFSEYNGTLLEFYCGGYGTFDSMCSKAISELKEKYPKSNIKKLKRLIPCAKITMKSFSLPSKPFP